MTRTCSWSLTLLLMSSCALRAGTPSRFHDFAQIGDGGGIRTVILLMNANAEAVDISFSTFASDGSPFVLTINGASSSQHDFSVPARGTLRLETPGQADSPIVGWGRLVASREVGAQALFEIRSQGQLVTQAAVADGGPMRGANFFIDQTTPQRSAVAIANLSSGTIAVALTATGADGSAGGTMTIELGPRSQTSRFFDELFPQLGDFRGTLNLNSSGPVTAIALLQTGLVIGSLSPVEIF